MFVAAAGVALAAGAAASTAAGRRGYERDGDDHCRYDDRGYDDGRNGHHRGCEWSGGDGVVAGTDAAIAGPLR